MSSFDILVEGLIFLSTNVERYVKVTEGTSALFLITSDAVEDRVADAMKQFKFGIIGTNCPMKRKKIV